MLELAQAGPGEVFEHLVFLLVAVEQHQVALALLLVVEEFAPVAQVFDEFPVAVNLEIAEMPEQRALGLGVFEDPRLDDFMFYGVGHQSVNF